MPHLRLEYSSNLREVADMGTLCRKLAHALTEQLDGGTPVYPTGAVRVRAYAADDYCIADGASDAAFVHAALQVGAGRSEAVRQATGDALFSVMKHHFADLGASRGLALSLEIAEFGAAGTWKHNNLHARYRKA